MRDAGFELDSKNWNYYVQILAQLKQFEEAFKTCEELLMPNWTGWFIARVRETMKNQLPLDARRKGSSPRHLRPIATTLYRLAQGYMELDQLGPWSGDARDQLQRIDEDYPHTVRAIKSMIRVHSSQEYEIFGGMDSPFALEDEEQGDDEEYPEEGSAPGDGEQQNIDTVYKL